MKDRLINIIKGNFLINENSTGNWSFILIFLVLSIVMISSSHSVDKKVHNISKLNEEVKSLRSQFVDTRSNLMQYQMESSILKKLNEKGIVSSKNPPTKIIVNVKN